MLRARLADALKLAMKDKNAKSTATLRLILAALKDRDIASRTKGKKETISEDEVLSLLQSMIKQRRESILLYEQGGRMELAQQEAEEIADNIFNKKTLDERIPTYEINSSEIEKSNFLILDAIEKLNLSKSRSDTKRLIKSRGIKVNNDIFLSQDLSLKAYYKLSEIKISVGKKHIGILKIKK